MAQLQTLNRASALHLLTYVSMKRHTDIELNKGPRRNSTPPSHLGVSGSGWIFDSDLEVKVPRPILEARVCAAGGVGVDDVGEDDGFGFGSDVGAAGM